MKTKYYTGSTAVNRELSAAEESRRHAVAITRKQPLSMSRGEVLKYVAAGLGFAAIIGSIAACAILCGV